MVRDITKVALVLFGLFCFFHPLFHFFMADPHAADVRTAVVLFFIWWIVQYCNSNRIWFRYYRDPTDGLLTIRRRRIIFFYKYDYVFRENIISFYLAFFYWWFLYLNALFPAFLVAYLALWFYLRNKPSVYH